MTSAAFPGALDVQARRLGRLVWVEEAVAVALGSVVARTEDDATVVRLAELIRDGVAAASVVRDRLPVLREFPVEDLVTGAALPSWRRLVGSLAASGSGETIQVCDDLVRPALALAYRRVLLDADPIGAPSVRRHLAPLAEPAPLEVAGSPDSAVALGTLVEELTAPI